MLAGFSRFEILACDERIAGQRGLRRSPLRAMPRGRPAIAQKPVISLTFSPHRLPSKAQAPSRGDTPPWHTCRKDRARTRFLVVASVLVLPGISAHRVDGEFDVDLPAFSNVSEALTRSPSRRAGDTCHHDMQGAGLELDRSAGRDLEPVGQLAHLHDAAVHLHFVNLEFPGGLGGAADQAVRRRARLVIFM